MVLDSVEPYRRRTVERLSIQGMGPSESHMTAIFFELRLVALENSIQ